MDVADADAVERAAAEIERALGPLDVWVNDAMATVLAPVHEISAEEFERATRVTYLGTVHGTMAALARMRRRNRGTIVQVGSALAYRAIPLQAPYCGAKFAIRGFTDSLRTELLHERSRIWITMVQLPAVNTPQFEWCLTRMPHHPQPVPPMFQPEVPAEAVYWAAHHRRRELWVGHSTIKAILASYLVPSLADRYLARTGYDAQQMTQLAVAADRPSNLFLPVPGRAATHGRFDDGATERSPQLWLAEHRSAVLAAGASALAAGLLADSAAMTAPPWLNTPHTLREYAMVADGERGAIVGPRGDIVWMCFPALGLPAALLRTHRRWRHLRGESDGAPRVGWLLRAAQPDLAQPLGDCDAIVECRHALALPARAGRATILARHVHRGSCRLVAVLKPLSDDGRHGMQGLRARRRGRLARSVGDLFVSWHGADEARVVRDGRHHALHLDLPLAEGAEHDLVLEISERRARVAPGRRDDVA